MKNYNVILGGILVLFILIGAGCSVRDAQPSPDSSNEESGTIEPVIITSKFPDTNLEYYLQSYRDHVLLSSQKLDKKKMKATIVVTAVDKATQKPLTATFYSDAKWNDGKEHIFDIEEVMGTSTRQFGQFSSVMKNFITEIQKIPNEKVVGDFMVIKGIKITK